jgi:hypothetical protein
MVMELNDPKTAIEAKCSPKCAAVMDTYKECAKRIEEKVREASRARRPQSFAWRAGSHDHRLFALHRARATALAT